LANDAWVSKDQYVTLLELAEQFGIDLATV
jgi:hypothetical protein